MTVHARNSGAPTDVLPAMKFLTGVPSAVVLSTIVTACGLADQQPNQDAPSAAASSAVSAVPSPSIPPSPTPPASTPSRPLDPTPIPTDGPPEVRERAPLPSCGHEVVERTPQGDLYDAEVRRCFLDAITAGEPAEFVTDGLTVEGGHVRSIYRHLRPGEIEVFVDWTQDPLGPGGWTRNVCRSIRIHDEDPNGVPIFTGDDCDEGEAIGGSTRAS